MSHYPTHRPDDFFAKIPRMESDPLNEIGNDIDDERESVDYEQIRGLSDEQVSQIAKDSLESQPFSGSPAPDSSLDAQPIDIQPQRS